MTSRLTYPQGDLVGRDLGPDPAAVATALKVWALPAYTTDPAVAAKGPSAPALLFGIAAGPDAPPPWPARWSLHRMDRA